jgi:hypothetical protein
MDDQLRQAVSELSHQLWLYWDDSDVPSPIKVGDPLHRAIVAYRKALGGRLPAGEGKLMRRMLDLSRSKKWQDRRDSQDVAEEWDELLERTYGKPRPIPPEVFDELTLAEAACFQALTYEPQRTADIAALAGLKDASTARKALPALARMKPPLAQKTRRGYVRARPK